jgi:sec-independent protein translocase protein TatA
MGHVCPCVTYTQTRTRIHKDKMINTLAFLTSTTDWIIVLVVVLLLFGGTKIPELLRGVGRGVGELQKGLEEGKKVIYNAADEAADKGTGDSKSRTL